jgi:hypothetical protein
MKFHLQVMPFEFGPGLQIFFLFKVDMNGRDNQKIKEKRFQIFLKFNLKFTVDLTVAAHSKLMKFGM